MENRFDIYELPEGHEERFEQKYDARLARMHRRHVVFRWASAAAVVVAFLGLGLLANRSSIRRANTPEAVYAAYLEQVGKLYELLAPTASNDSVDWEAVLYELTEENVPLYDQLPEELSRREKTEILKKHYGSILHEAEQLPVINQK